MVIRARAVNEFDNTDFKFYFQAKLFQARNGSEHAALS